MISKTVGEILKTKRRAKKISLKELAAKSQIKLAYLEALEENRWSLLPEIAFIRGYIKTYARLLQFNPQIALAILRRDYSPDTTRPSQLLSRLKMNQSFLPRFNWLALNLFLVVLVVIGYLSFQWYLSYRPPKLIIYTPANQAQVISPVIVRGVTLPQAKVIVNNQQVALEPDGSFTTEIKFPTSGLAAIIVQAEDSRGHTAKIIRYVQIK